MKKRLFVLLALVALFTASSAKAEVMEYLGTSLDVSSILTAWGQKIDEVSWAQVCLLVNKQIDDSHFDISFNDGVEKCSATNSAFYHNLFNANGTLIGWLIDIPVEVPDKEKVGCEAGKEKECYQFEHYRLTVKGVDTTVATQPAQQAATATQSSEPVITPPPAPKVAVTPPPPVTPPPTGSPAMIFISGELRACFSFTETTTNSLGIDTGQKPVTHKECGVITSLTNEENKLLASVATKKETFKGIPFCILEDISASREESVTAMKEFKDKQCK